MQEQSIIVDADVAKEKLNNALLRLEQAIWERNQRNYQEEKTRIEVAKELDMYLSSLDALLNDINNKK
jgi:hypothetical protein